MPIHTYLDWNKRPSDLESQIEPYKKYIFICEGVNTEVWYFRRLVELRKKLGIHPLIDIRLWEKTGTDKDCSYPQHLARFAREQKNSSTDDFDPEIDKLVVVFDADIFEEKVKNYDELIQFIEEEDIAAITNPGFELFLLLHIENSYNDYIKGKEALYLKKEDGSYSFAQKTLKQITGMNSKKNRRIGELAENVMIAINQEQFINQDIHKAKGVVTSNIGKIIESIINEKIAI